MASGLISFQTTSWSNVAAAQKGSSTIARRSLEGLIDRYWRPVYFFVRQRGRSAHDAADITQQFFTEFFERDIISYADRERGKFRTFLLASVSRFLAQQHRLDHRKRIVKTISGIGEAERALAFAPSGAETPEEAFERNWAKCLIENCLARLSEECKAIGKDLQFRVFEARFVQEVVDYAVLAKKFGISETDVDNLLRRTKKRFGRILKQEVADCTLTSKDASEEMSLLLAYLST